MIRSMLEKILRNEECMCTGKASAIYAVAGALATEVYREQSIENEKNNSAALGIGIAGWSLVMYSLLC